MKPIEFDKMTCVYAKDQKEYLPLPVHKYPDGTITCCWQLTLKERIRLLFTGVIWCRILTFNKPLQPHLLTVTDILVEDLGELT